MKRIGLIGLLMLISIFSITILAQQSEQLIELTDIETLEGEWTGTLTYVDYSSNKPYTMPCNVTISPKRKNRKLILSYEYPNEPSANGNGKMKISKNRSKLNKKSIISRKVLTDGNVEIITQYKGRDGNKRKSALIRNSYIIGPSTFVIKKEVKFKGTDEWLRRNEYSFNR